MSSSREIRETFLEYFASRGHERVASGPLVPANDPTLMFSNAGMVPFKDVFTGKDERAYTRATSAQKCIRISGKHNDLENVGRTARHHTFFEMLGNFSFGDYFKRGAIEQAWELFIDVMKVDPERLVVTVFGGEPGFGDADDEAASIWKDVTGFSDERVIRCAAKENFWQMGETGPCGPCTEIHYFQGDGKVDPGTFGEEPSPDGQGWFELWNLVFMQFNRQADGRMLDLPAPSVDTGAGLERLAVVKQGVLSNYDTDLLKPLVGLASEISGKKYTGTQSPDDVSMRVIADHARMAAFCISEGIFPDKDGRPYVLRRVMRRAIRHGHQLGIGDPFMHEVTKKVVEEMGEAYPQLAEHRDLIADITQQEEERFRRTLDRGLSLLAENERWSEDDGKRTLPGAVAFKLYDTFGFPLDLQDVIGEEQGFAVDHEGFDAEMKTARARSAGSAVGDAAVADVYPRLHKKLGDIEFTGYEREQGESQIAALVVAGDVVETLEPGQAAEVITASTPFYGEKGGQAGDVGTIRAGEATFEVEDTVIPTEGFIVHRGRMREGRFAVSDSVELSVGTEERAATRRNHSATHLMHWALREVVGSTATQKGSLVSADRLRFDYSATRPLEAEEIARIEDLVNGAILSNTPVATEVLPMDEAKEKGAIGIFEEKYGDVVRVLQVGPSLELCGGTHARRTGDIGLFKILSDGGLAAGVRRIEATSGRNALSHLRAVEAELAGAAALLKGRPSETRAKVARMLEQRQELSREVARLTKSLMSGESADLSADARDADGFKVLCARVDLGDAKALREMAEQLKDKLSPAVVLLASESKGKVLLACSVSKEISKKHPAGKLAKEAAGIVGGGGGGRPDFAQAGGSDPSKIDDALACVYHMLGVS